MDISNFFTLQAPVAGQKTSGVSTSGSALLAPGSLNFLDFILAHLSQEKTGEKPELIQPQEHQLLSSDNPALDSDINIAELIAANPEIAEEIESMGLDPNMQLSQALALNQAALDEALAPVTDGIITTANVEAGSPRLMQALLVDAHSSAPAFEGSALKAKLKAILAKIETLEAEPETGGLLLANLTPAQMGDLKVKIEALLNEDVDTALTEEQKRQALDGIYIGLIKLLAPNEQSQTAALQATIQKQQSEQNAQINDFIRPAPKTAGTAAAPDDALNTDPIPETSSPAPTDKFANILKDFSGKKGGTELNVKTPAVKPDLSMLQGWPFTINGSIFAPTQLPFDDYAAHAAPLNVTSLGTLTNLVTQAHTASQAHPAMQTIAATISKGAASGETKNITLQLEPPELGRVEIRMSFSKDKTMKAVVVAEKAETHLMLQRDSHMLERALIDSGLDASGSELSFELADSGYQFNGDGNGSRGGSGGGLDNAPDEIIETTMTWRVDPETGHMRYSILA